MKDKGQDGSDDRPEEVWDLSTLLQLARRFLAQSQGAAAHAIGCSIETYRQWEREGGWASGDEWIDAICEWARPAWHNLWPSFARADVEHAMFVARERKEQRDLEHKQMIDRIYTRAKFGGKFTPPRRAVTGR